MWRPRAIAWGDARARRRREGASRAGLTSAGANAYNAVTRALLTCLLLLGVVRGARSDEVSPPGPAGRLETAERVYDAGKVDRGSTIRHVFLLRNTGAVALNINAVPG